MKRAPAGAGAGYEKNFSQEGDDSFGKFSRIIFGTGYVAIEKQIVNP